MAAHPPTLAAPFAVPSRRPGAARRSVDIAAALLALALLWPAMALVALSLVATGVSWQRVVFLHPRVGRGGCVFGCAKFRTMRDWGDGEFRDHLASNPEAAREWEATGKLSRDPRVTPLGAWLRRTSLDELPQFLNILSGDMSLVGPRPVTKEELPRYGAAVTAYLSVRPGLTGPWQVSGRSDVGWEERVRMDAEYARSPSFLHDLAILLATPAAVLARRGAR